MQELEKILEEIDIKIAESMGKKREGILEAHAIIRKHMNDGWIPVEECREAVRDDICNNYCEYRNTMDEDGLCDKTRDGGSCPLDRM